MCAYKSKQRRNKLMILKNTAEFKAQRYELEALEQSKTLKRVHLLSKPFNQQSKVCQ